MPMKVDPHDETTPATGDSPRRAKLTLAGLGFAYMSVATVAANAVILALMIFLIAHVADALLARREGARDISRDVVPNTRTRVTLGQLYPGMSPQDLKTLMTETWSRPFSCDPWAQFGERPCSGRYVNVDRAGFRRSSRQATWPPPAGTNVFLFGGSTLFGYGLPDDETIPSKLARHLDRSGYPGINIYNFGRGFYFSTQEMMLLSGLLSEGHHPDLVIFLDGLNEFFAVENRPRLTPQMEAVFNGQRESPGYALRVLIRRLPFMRLMAGPNAEIGGFRPPMDDPITDPGAAAQLVTERYFRNASLIESLAKARGIQTLFVWQPVPVYAYDPSEHPFGKVDLGRTGQAIAIGYGLLDPKRRDRDPRGPGAWLWLGEMQRIPDGPAYIDRVHYSSKMSEAIGAEIGRAIIERRLLSQPPPSPPDRR